MTTVGDSITVIAVATTTGTDMKEGIGAVTIVTTLGARGLAKMVKKFTGHHDYQDDYNKALKGPCQLHPRSSRTMENCRVLRTSTRSRSSRMMLQRLQATMIGIIMKRTMMIKSKTPATSTSIQLMSSIPFLVARYQSSPKENASSSGGHS